MTALLAAAAAAFAATNLDDLLLLCLLFGRADSRRDKGRIALGQVLGLTVLTGISLLCALGLAALPHKWLRLLGLVPIALAIRLLLAKDREAAGSLPLSVTGVTALAVANGGDNLGVYIPYFAQLTGPELTLAALLFVALAGLWCLLALWLIRLPALRAFLGRWSERLVPVVFLLLGIGILLG